MGKWYNLLRPSLSGAGNSRSRTQRPTVLSETSKTFAICSFDMYSTSKSETVLSTRVDITTRPQSRNRFFQQQFEGRAAIREGRYSRLNTKTRYS